MFCQKCGKNISDDEYYCPYCGKEMPKKRNLINVNNKITILDCFKNFFVKGFSTDGVSTRKEFWVIYIIYIIQNIVLGVLSLNYINTILNIILFFPINALAIRRYHDINMSGGFASIGIYAIFGYMFSFFFKSDKVTTLLFLITSIIALVTQLFLLTKPTNEKSRWNPINGYM